MAATERLAHDWLLARGSCTAHNFNVSPHEQALGFRRAFCLCERSVCAAYRCLLAIASMVSLILFLMAARGLRRRSELDPEAKVVRVSTSLWGREWWTRELDVSDAAWVRARPIGSKTQLVVEVGTVGYSTREVARVVSDKNQGIPLAEMLCARVAVHLNIVDKGYKSVA